MSNKQNRKSKSKIDFNADSIKISRGVYKQNRKVKIEKRDLLLKFIGSLQKLSIIYLICRTHTADVFHYFIKSRRKASTESTAYFGRFTTTMHTCRQVSARQHRSTPSQKQANATTNRCRDVVGHLMEVVARTRLTPRDQT